MTQTLELENISKSYGPIHSLSNVSLRFSFGEKIVVLGANGSGKTTLLKLLSFLIRPSSGVIYFNEKKVDRDPISMKRRIGYVGHNIHLYQDLTVMDNLMLYGKLQGLPHLSQRIIDMAQEFDTVTLLPRIVRTLSRGNQQKINIMRSLLHKPSILLMDEIFSHLDSCFTPFLIHKINLYVPEKLMVLSTHQKEIAEAVGNRWLVLHLGRVAQDQSLASGTFQAVWDQYLETGRT